VTPPTAIHQVAIVLDPDFGDRLPPLSATMHVWIVNTPGNRAAIGRAGAPAYSPDRGVTTMNASDGSSSEPDFAGTLSTVDLHHGWHSHNPPWTVLHCFGLRPTTAVREALEEYGVDEIREGPDGFVATRPVPPLPE
jgi:hypothetical protein